MARDRDDEPRDDDMDDRPARRRRDDDDAPAAALGPLDKMFRDTNVAILVIFGLCCNGIALILGLVGVFTAKDPKAKTNATIVAAIGGIVTVIGIIVRVIIPLMSGALNQ